MEKVKLNCDNQIKIKVSDPFLNCINKARMLCGTKEKFGKNPTQDQFLKGIIYYWIKKHAPEVLIDDLNINILEILEHKELKNKL